MFCSVLFFSRPRSESWPHHGRTLSIYVWGSKVMELLLHILTELSSVRWLQCRTLPRLILMLRHNLIFSLTWLDHVTVQKENKGNFASVCSVIMQRMMTTLQGVSCLCSFTSSIMWLIHCNLLTVSSLTYIIHLLLPILLWKLNSSKRLVKTVVTTLHH